MQFKQSSTDPLSKKFLEQPFTSIHDLVLGEEDARACKDISDAACHEQPKSFGVHVIASSLSKIGDALADTKLTLAWLLTSLGAPPFLIAWLVPIRESLALLPQLIVASAIRRHPVRKHFWTFGSIAQGISMIGIGCAGLLLPPTLAGYTIIGLLVIFSLARGCCSIASKDVLGKTIAKQRRGRIGGLAGAIAGMTTLLFGSLLFAEWLPMQSARALSGLIILAGVLWLLAAYVFRRLPEQPGATEGGVNGFLSAFENIHLIWKDKVLLRFLITRSLLISTALVAPFYVWLANQKSNNSLAMLGLLLVLAGLANVSSSPLWGKFADWSSRKVMMLAGAICGTLALVTASVEWLELALRDHFLWYGFLIFALYIGHAGVRLGRKTYLIDLTTQENRADYVAVSNTVIGLVLLATGGLSTLILASGPVWGIVIMGGLSFAAVFSAASLPEVTQN